MRKFWILYNRVLLNLKKVSYGSGLRICDYVSIKMKGNNTFTIGKNFGFSSGAYYNPLARNIHGAIELEKGAQLIIGNNVGISSSCLWVYDKLVIGDNTKIGGDTLIIDSDCHSLDPILRSCSTTDRPNAKKSPITIGKNVLVGTRCIILKGVTIGDNSVIGSGSVVTRDIPENCIAAGNPCRVIKYINSNEKNSNTSHIS